MFGCQGAVRKCNGGTMKKKKIIILLIIAGHIIGLGVIKRLFLAKSPVTQPALLGRRSAEKTTVKADRVKRQDLDFILLYVGSLKAKDEVIVFSKVPGKLARYEVSEGDKIEKGEVIALLDRDETGLKYELARVESPLSGIVGRTLLDKGAQVSPASATGAQGLPIAIVINMNEMVVKLGIRGQDIAYIKKGLKASLEIDSYPNEDFYGEVSKVSEIIDADTRTLPIEITISNPEHRLKSGMFARIKLFAGTRPQALVIPRDALVKENTTDYVYVVEDSTARKIKVKIGLLQDSNVEVLEGLQEHQRLIIFGQQGLKDGSAINVIE